jgi:hypothetical protein
VGRNPPTQSHCQAQTPKPRSPGRATPASYSAPAAPSPRSAAEEGKDEPSGHVGFQQRVTNALKPVDVAPGATGWRARLTRARNLALSGVSVDVHSVGGPVFLVGLGIHLGVQTCFTWFGEEGSN